MASANVMVIAPGDIRMPHTGDVEYAAALERMLRGAFSSELDCFEGHSILKPRVYYYFGLPRWVGALTSRLLRKRGFVVPVNHLGVTFWTLLLKWLFRLGYRVVPYVDNVSTISPKAGHRSWRRFANSVMWLFSISRSDGVIARSGLLNHCFPADLEILWLPNFTIEPNVFEGDEARWDVRSLLGIGPDIHVIGVIGPFHKYNRTSIQYIRKRIDRFKPSSLFLMIGDVSKADMFQHDRVKFIGRVERIHDYIKACDCILIPRFIHWGAPMGKMITAMACGVPVVTNDFEEMPAEPGREALLGSLEKLPELVNNVLSDGELAKKLGENAKAFARKHYSAEYVAPKLIEFLKSIEQREI